MGDECRLGDSLKIPDILPIIIVMEKLAIFQVDLFVWLTRIRDVIAMLVPVKPALCILRFSTFPTLYLGNLFPFSIHVQRIFPLEKTLNINTILSRLQKNRV